MIGFKSRKIKNIYQHERSFARNAVFSFEFFPPKSEAGELQLHEAITELKKLEPGFISVTCGAGGSTRHKTNKWSKKIQNEYGVTAMSHYTSIGIRQKDVKEHLKELMDTGIQNVMALRGDLPSNLPNYEIPEDGFAYASDLIAYIRRLGFPFSIGAACYPEIHPEASSAEDDLRHLKEKVDAGADFLISQLFFINESYFRFLERCRAAHIDLPIIPGIMPITNFKQVERFTTMTGCKFPSNLLKKIAGYGDNKRELYKLSLDYSLEQCQELLNQKVPGIHFYTLNQSSLTKDIFIQLG